MLVQDNAHSCTAISADAILTGMGRDQLVSWTDGL